MSVFARKVPGSGIAGSKHCVFLLLFICLTYLAAPGLSCGIGSLILVVVCELLVAVCGV